MRTNDVSLDQPFNEERKYDEFFEVNLRSPIMLTGEKKPWLSDKCLMKCRLYMLLKEMIQDAAKGYSDSLAISNEM